jgi:hypothetical protein
VLLTASVAVPVSVILVENEMKPTSESVAVAVSVTAELYTAPPANAANGASAKVEIPNTLPRQT